MGPDNRAIAVSLRYVPDKFLLPAEVFARYLANLDSDAWQGIEAMGLDMLGDLDSEILPRWLQVKVGVGDGHRVTLEQRQPNWENRVMMVRIPID